MSKQNERNNFAEKVWGSMITYMILLVLVVVVLLSAVIINVCLHPKGWRASGHAALRNRRVRAPHLHDVIFQ